MSETYEYTSLALEIVEDQTESLFRELELAFQWQRPSLLFAIYESRAVREAAEYALQSRIVQSGKNVIHFHSENDDPTNLDRFVSETTNKEGTVFFIEPLNSDCKKGLPDDLYKTLNSSRDYLIDNLFRVVFWVTEKEAFNLAHNAPDFWASRHRVVEFTKEKNSVETKIDGLIPFRHTKSEKDAFANKTPHQNKKIFSGKILNGTGLEKIDQPESGEIDINGLLALGVTSWKKGENKKASEYLEAALEIAEISGNIMKQAMCYKAIALVKSDSEKFVDAIEAYNKVIKLGQDDITVWNNLGSLYKKAGRSAEAFNAFRNALLKAPNNSISWNGIGSVLANLGRTNQAIESFTKAIQFNASYAAPWISLGDLYLKQNRDGDAIHAYSRSAEMDPKNSHVWFEIGGIYFKAGSYKQAIDAYKKAIELGCVSETLHGNLAQAYFSIGFEVEAIPHFRKAIALTSEVSQKAILWNKLGDAYRQINDHENSTSAYKISDRLSTAIESCGPYSEMKENLKNKPGKETIQVHDVLNYAANRHEDKISFSKEAQNYHLPERPVVVHASEKRNSDVKKSHLWVQMASIFLKISAFDKAIDAYHKAVDSDPHDARNYTNLASVYTQQGKFADAISFHKQSIELLPSDKEKAITLTVIGDLYRKLKDYISAMEAYESAIGYDPDNATILTGLSNIQDDLSRFTSTQDSNEKLVLDAQGIPGEDDRQQSRTVSIVTDGPLADDVSEQQTVGNDAAIEEPADANDQDDENAAYEDNGPMNLSNANVWNELGNVLAQTNAFDDAIDAYNKAIELNPEFGWSYCNLAMVYSKQGKSEEALDLFQKSITLLGNNPDKAITWNRLGDLYRETSKYDEAIKAYENADKLSQGISDSNVPSSEMKIDQPFSHFVA